jgi:hypothetical protein
VKLRVLRFRKVEEAAVNKIKEAAMNEFMVKGKKLIELLVLAAVCDRQCISGNGISLAPALHVTPRLLT